MRQHKGQAYFDLHTSFSSKGKGYRVASDSNRPSSVLWDGGLTATLWCKMLHSLSMIQSQWCIWELHGIVLCVCTNMFFSLHKNFLQCLFMISWSPYILNFHNNMFVMPLTGFSSGKSSVSGSKILFVTMSCVPVSLHYLPFTIKKKKMSIWTK